MNSDNRLIPVEIKALSAAPRSHNTSLVDISFISPGSFNEIPDLWKADLFSPGALYRIGTS